MNFNNINPLCLQSLIDNYRYINNITRQLIFLNYKNINNNLKYFEINHHFNKRNYFKTNQLILNHFNNSNIFFNFEHLLELILFIEDDNNIDFLYSLI